MNTRFHQGIAGFLITGVAMFAAGCGAASSEAPAKLPNVVETSVQSEPERYGGPDKYEHQQPPQRYFGGPDRFDYQGLCARPDGPNAGCR